MSSSLKRKSVAVMFTDIGGYTKHMTTDEEKALSLLHTKCDIIKPLIKKYDGVYSKELKMERCLILNLPIKYQSELKHLTST